MTSSVRLRKYTNQPPSLLSLLLNLQHGTIFFASNKTLPWMSYTTISWFSCCTNVQTAVLPHLRIELMCRILVEDLLALGVEQGSAQMRPTKHRVVRADNSYCGEIQVGVSFNVKVHISLFVHVHFFSFSVMFIHSSYRLALCENNYCSIPGHADGRGMQRTGVWRVAAEWILDLFEPYHMS